MLYNNNDSKSKNNKDKGSLRFNISRPWGYYAKEVDKKIDEYESLIKKMDSIITSKNNDIENLKREISHLKNEIQELHFQMSNIELPDSNEEDMIMSLNKFKNYNTKGK